MRCDHTYFARHAEVLAVVATAAAVTCIEITLLDVKYEAFRGGFLQSHQIRTLLDRALFLVAAFILHVSIFGLLGIAWFRIARRIGIDLQSRVFDWLVWSLLGSTFISAVRYQIHSYFGDFLTFTVAKSLGGGSVTDALQYVVNEAAISLGALVVVISLYVVARRRVARAAQHHLIGNNRLSWRIVAWICAIASVTVIGLVAQSETMWYHMRRTNIYYSLDRLLNWATDFDSDGYGVLTFPKDPAPFDSTIYPGALDRPGNGIDEDGFLGDFVYAPRPERQVRPLGNVHPNIVLIVLESLRADALHATVSNGLRAMPFLAGLAAEGTYSPNYFSHTGYTSSSVKSIYSGSVGETAPALLLPALSNAGYEIHVISGQDEHFGDIAKAAGLDRFAATFFDAKSMPTRRVFASSAPGSLTLSNDDVAMQFASVAQRANWNRPQFFYINLQAAHFPYYHNGMQKRLTQDVLSRGDIRPNQASKLRETYLNACANNDITLEALVSQLRQRGEWDRTLLVAVGDHGESLFDDGFLGHGFIISRTQLNTAFVSNRRIAVPAVLGHADLAPLILSQSGFEVDPLRRQTRGVVHYLGTLDRPSMIGMTMPDGLTLAFDLSSKRITVESAADGRSFAGSFPLPANSPYEDALKETILEWEHLRWEAHLRKDLSASQRDIHSPTR